jgi:hypothetical protein
MVASFVIEKTEPLTFNQSHLLQVGVEQNAASLPCSNSLPCYVTYGLDSIVFFFFFAFKILQDSNDH